MEPTAQIIRLSIPGSIFVLTGVGTYAFAQVLWGESLSDIPSLTTITTSITAIAASIPLGFLIYQIYYWRYSPFILGDVVARDRGREALSGLPPEILPRLRTLFDARLDIRRNHESLSGPISRRLKLFRLNHGVLRERYKDGAPVEGPVSFERDDRSIRRVYKDNWYENWDVFRALLDLVATRGGHPEIQRNFNGLYDIYHSLGASRLAVALGAIGGVLYLGGAHQGDIEENLAVSLIGLIAIAIVAAFLTYIIHRTRLATWKSAISKVRLDLISYFKTNPEFVELLPEANGFTPRRELRRADQRQRKYGRPLSPGLVRPAVRRLLGDIGSIEWTQRTRGILGRRERVRFRLATSISIGSELPRILAARAGRRAAGPDPSAVAIPDTRFAGEVIRACETLDPMVREHGYRTYVFGLTLATVEGVDCDEEALFAAAMLHHYSFPVTEQPRDGCFTVASADVATRLLNGSSLPPDAQHDVLDAIALHLNPVVDLDRGPIQRFTHGGVLLDVLGQRATELDPEGIERVIRRHPRLGFTVRGRNALAQHGKSVRGCRTQILFGAGLGAALKTGRWHAHDGD